MAGLFERQAEIYARARPTYPDDWFSKLASLTSHHKVAWDAGTGNGQAAIKLAEHYDNVIATDISESQIKNAFPHPKIHYQHTPSSTTEEDYVTLLGGEDSIDLITVATAVHWFDLPSFYSVVNRVLRKPGGIIAVWSYVYNIKFTSLKDSTYNPFDHIMQRIYNVATPYIDPRANYAFEEYKTLPFPFESVGMGSEGNPVELDMELELSLDEYVTWMRTSSAVSKAKAEGVELIDDELMNEIRAAWGDDFGSEKKKLTLKAHMLVGKPKLSAN